MNSMKKVVDNRTDSCIIRGSPSGEVLHASEEGPMHEANFRIRFSDLVWGFLVIVPF